MIKKFKEMLEDDTDIIDIDVLLPLESQKGVHNKWLTIFQQLTPFNIPTGLKKIVGDVNLTQSDEIVLLAYIKFFEQRIFEMAKADAPKEEDKKKKKYDGAMFG